MNIAALDKGKKLARLVRAGNKQKQAPEGRHLCSYSRLEGI